MSNATQILIGTTLALTAACGYMVYRVDVVSERAAANARLAAQQQVRVAELDKQRAALESEVARLRQQAAAWSAMQSKPVQPADAPTARREPNAPQPLRPSDPSAAEPLGLARNVMPLNDWAQSPAGREMMRAQRRMGVQRMYADFFRDMNLTAEQAEKFVDVMTELEMRGNAQAVAMRGDPNAMQAMMRERETRTRKELTELLGADGYKQFESYRNSFAERLEVSQIALQMEAMRTPLRDDQRSELLTAMIEERNRMPQPNATPSSTPEESIEKHLQWKQDYDQRVRDRMASVLTTDQLKRLTEYQELQANMQRMGLQFSRRAMLRPPAPGGVVSQNAIVVSEGVAAGMPAMTFALPAPPPPPPESRQ